MGLKVHKPEGHDWVVADETLWLTADRERLVPDGHRDAAFLFSTPGKRIDHATAVKYGLADAPKAKQADPPANKAVEAPDADKAKEPAEPAVEKVVDSAPAPDAPPAPVKPEPVKKAAAKKAPKGA